MNIDIDNFYERVKNLLKEHKKSLDDLMAIKDLSFNAKSTYFSMRQARNLPRADDVLRIAKFFGVSMEYLVTGCQSDNQEKIDRIVENLMASIDDIKNLKQGS